jgi:hypothetical protein
VSQCVPRNNSIYAEVVDSIFILFFFLFYLFGSAINSKHCNMSRSHWSATRHAKVFLDVLPQSLSRWILVCSELLVTSFASLFRRKFLRHKSGQPARRCGTGDHQGHGCDTYRTHGTYIPFVLICFFFILDFVPLQLNDEHGLTIQDNDFRKHPCRR